MSQTSLPFEMALANAQDDVAEYNVQTEYDSEIHYGAQYVRLTKI